MQETCSGSKLANGLKLNTGTTSMISTENSGEAYISYNHEEHIQGLDQLVMEKQHGKFPFSGVLLW